MGKYDWRLRGLAFALLLDRDEMDAALGTAYLRAWRDVVRVHAKDDIAAWLYRTTYNACVDRLRLSRSVAGAGAAGRSRAGARADGLVAGLAELPETGRVALVLVDREGFGPEAAARIMGLSPAMVEARLVEARAHMAPHLPVAVEEAATDPDPEASPELGVTPTSDGGDAGDAGEDTVDAGVEPSGAVVAGGNGHRHADPGDGDADAASDDADAAAAVVPGGNGRGEAGHDVDGDGVGHPDAESEGDGEASPVAAGGNGRGEAGHDVDGDGVGDPDAESDVDGDGVGGPDAEGGDGGETVTAGGNGHGEAGHDVEGDGVGDPDAEGDGDGETVMADANGADGDGEVTRVPNRGRGRRARKRANHAAGRAADGQVGADGDTS